MSDEKNITLVMNLRSEPFGDDPEYATGFYEAIGRITVTWGRAESSLDILLLIAMDIAAKHGIRESLPVGIERKLTLLKHLYRDCPALIPLKENVYSLARAISATHQNRSALSHTFFQGFVEGNPPAMQFYTLQHKQGKLDEGTYRFTLKRLNRVIRMIDHIHTRIIGLILDRVPLGVSTS